MTLRTVALVVALAIGMVLPPLAVRAQPPATKVARIAFLGLAAPTPAAEQVLDALRQGLRDLGWVEGRNLILETRWAHGRPERLPDLAGELVGLRVDLIVANCGPQIPAIRKASSTIPVVISACPDLVGFGLASSLARPGGSITGLGMLSLELNAKRLELLKEAFPKVSRVAVLGHAAYDWTVPMKEMEAAARVLGMRPLQTVVVRGPEEFERAFGEMTRERAEALYVPADPFTFLNLKQILALAAKRRLPTMFEIREYVDAGGLMSYGPSLPAMFRRAATYVDKILKGAKPGDLPVEQPTKFDLVINLKTAKALGLRIPQSVLIRADEVIQ